MRRELFIHFSLWFSYFVLISLINGLFKTHYWPFWLGGLIGMILPDLDHLIYAYFIKPTDLSSQRVLNHLKTKDFKRGLSLLYETRNERRELVFHSIFFQLIFLVPLFWILSSSNSFFGRGLAISFALHLAIDQLIDYVESGSLENWFNNLPFRLNSEQSKNYLIGTAIVMLLMGLLV
jgi:hypothetical protein